MSQNSRRNFLKTASMGTMAAISIPQIVSAAVGSAAPKKVIINKDDVILFQGDSITDWGRDRKLTEPNTTNSLGYGYVLLTASELLAKHYDKNLKIYNRGVGGNKVFQLADRWDTDCIAIKPNILSIHIGVNDFWHTLTSGYKGTVETYITDYRKLLDRTKQALPNVKMIIGEPFGLLDTKSVSQAWYPTFQLFKNASRDIAQQYDLPFIPYQAVFTKALEKAPATYWTIDGVHPSIAGEKLMSEAWLQMVK